MSELRNNENFEAGSPKPTLCVDCNEFFGHAHTENLCSKCFRNKSKETEANMPRATSIINQVSTLSPQTHEKTTLENKHEEVLVEEVKTKEPQKLEEQSKQKDSTRCFQCNKKVGLLGFKCPCESTFCRSHRQPEVHNCGFDFAKAGKEKLAKENFIVKANKVQKF